MSHIQSIYLSLDQLEQLGTRIKLDLQHVLSEQSNLLKATGDHWQSPPSLLLYDKQNSSRFAAGPRAKASVVNRPRLAYEMQAFEGGLLDCMEVELHTHNKDLQGAEECEQQMPTEDAQHASDAHHLDEHVAEYAQTENLPSEDTVRIPTKSSCGSDFGIQHQLLNFVRSSRFEVVSTMLIVVNTICLAVETQLIGLENGYAMAFPGYTEAASEYWTDSENVFSIIEKVFTIIFTLELAFRFCVLRLELLTDAPNYIDIFAVVLALFDWIANANVPVNPLAGRVLRLGRFGRLLRVIKTSRRLGSLRLLLRSVIASASTLSWSLLLLFVVQCIAGMIFTLLVSDVMMDEDVDLKTRHAVFNYYGTFSRSMITMIEIHLANFAPACRVLVTHVGEEYAYIFLLYRCIVGFAVLNVINAVFIQQTMQAAQQDHEIMLEQKSRSANRYKQELKKMFDKFDTEGDGKVTFTELRMAVETEPAMKYWMAALELDTHDLESLFTIIDQDGDQLITYEEFVMAASKVKGAAKAVDMVTVLSSVRQVASQLNRLQSKIDLWFKEVKAFPSTPSCVQRGLDKMDMLG